MSSKIFVILLSAATTVSAQDAITAERFYAEHPTLHNLGFPLGDLW